MSNKLKVTHRPAVEARQAEPERWECERRSVERYADGKLLLRCRNGDQFMLDGIHVARSFHAILTAILSPERDAPAPVPPVDNRRVVGAVVKDGSAALYVVVKPGAGEDVQRRLILPPGYSGPIFSSAEDTFVRWATREECERHGIPYVDRSAPPAPAKVVPEAVAPATEFDEAGERGAFIAWMSKWTMVSVWRDDIGFQDIKDHMMWRAWIARARGGAK